MPVTKLGLQLNAVESFLEVNVASVSYVLNLSLIPDKRKKLIALRFNLKSTFVHPYYNSKL